MDIPYFVYPFVSWRICEFPLFSHYEWRHYDHPWTHFYVDVCFQFSWVCTSQGIGKSQGSSMFNIWDIVELSSKAAALSYILTHQCTRVPICPYPCQHLLFSYGSHLNVGKVISHCGFGFNFSNDQWSWASCHVLVGHTYIFFWGNICLSSLPIFKSGCLNFCCRVVGVLSIFWMLGPYQTYNLQVSFPILCVPFFNRVLWNTKVSNFGRIQLIFSWIA